MPGSAFPLIQTKDEEEGYRLPVAIPSGAAEENVSGTQSPCPMSFRVMLPKERGRNTAGLHDANPALGRPF